MSEFRRDAAAAKPAELLVLKVMAAKATQWDF